MCVCVCVCVCVYTNRVDGGVWVDLQCVDVVCGVLEEAVVRVEHLVAQQVQPLPVGATTPGQHTRSQQTPISN